MVIETTAETTDSRHAITGHAGSAQPQDVAHAQCTNGRRESTEMTKKNSDRDEALARLRAIVKPGDTLYTTCPHVSRSGMSRLINVHAISDGAPQWLSGYIARAGLFSLDKREALRVGGCGMDMGFHVVHTLSRSLYPGGFGCVGERCPSNDHFNGDRDYTVHGTSRHRCTHCQDVPGKDGLGRPCKHCTGGDVVSEAAHWHRDGGYALRQRWM